MKHLIENSFLLILFIFACLFTEVMGQAFTGYTLFGPNNSKYTYLVDMNNTVVKTWTHSKNGGYSAYLLEDGSVIRTATSSSSSLNGGGAQGVVQKYNKNGVLTWEYTYSSTTYRSHHDICPMPNGNVLLIAWEVKTAAECVAAGLNHSASLWPDHIIEVQPVGSTGGNIVWKWHVWDHLIQDYDATKNNYGVVGNHPELLDINLESTSGDWMHYNGIDYNPISDQIVFSSHNLDEVYVIDHSTTIQEAAGHSGGRWGKGGDFLYRWGRPSNYRATGTQVFNVVHCGVWVPAGLPGTGNIMAFNNREGQGTSMIVEITPPTDTSGNYIRIPGSPYGPTSTTWSYTASGFYSQHLGGVQRLPNGNTLIVQSTSGKMFEVNSAGTVVWTYNRGGEIVRAWRYAPDYPGILALLPVEFTTFTASVIDEKVVLNWTTATETNNSHFEIERKSGDEDFKVIGKVNGNGTSAIPTNYIYTDELITTSNIQYRLKQVDFDGSFSFSNILTLNDGEVLSNFSLSQNYPNPFNPSTQIKFTTGKAGWTDLKVYNSLGQQVATLFGENVIAGKNYSCTFNASSLPSGIYYYVLTNSDRRLTKSMVLLK